MKKTKLIIILTFVSLLLNAQKNPVVSITKLTDNNGKLKVDYSILYTNPEQIFDIELHVSHLNETPIIVKTTTGDIGEKIVGGTGKQIIWDYEKDGIFLDENVNVQLTADVSIDANYHSTAKLLLISTFLPGKGVNMLNRTKPFAGWLILGYGFVGTSAGFYAMSSNTYSNYTNATSVSDRGKYYSKYQTQLIISGVSALGAIGVWGINYFRIFSTKKMMRNMYSNWQLLPNYDYFTNTNFLTLSYKF